jgi:replicative DNA helicase
MDVERSLVSRIIATGEIENVIARGIDEDHFADEECQEVYAYTITHLKKYKGAPSMKAIKDKFPSFEPELGEDSIDYLTDRHIVNVKRRLANEALMSLAEAAEDPERAEEIDIEFLDISRQLATVVPTTAVARFSDMHKRIDQYRKDKVEGNQWGIRMGIPALDEKTFGIQPHELVVCAGFQGTGKSTLMQHIGFTGYLQGKTVLFVSLEMDEKPLLRKFDTMAVDMSHRQLKGLDLPDEAVNRWEKWADDAEADRDHGKDIIIIDRIGSRTATGVYAETIRHKPDMVIVDYISLLETGRTGSEKHWQQIGQISRELKLNAQTLGIPVIAAAQTNRDSVKEGVKLETIAFCVPMGTEILTRRGWKFYDEILPGDETIGFDPDLGSSRWTAINNVHRFNNAPVVEIGHSNWKAQVTPDHQWIGEVPKRRYEGCFKNSQGEWRYKYGPRDWQFSKLTTRDIPMESRIRLAAPFAQMFGREQVSPSEQDAALIGWLLTDGTLQQKEKTKYHDRFNKPVAVKAHIFQKKPEQIEIIRSLLEEINHSEHRSSSGKIQFTIFANEARSLLERSGYNWDPVQFVLSLNPSSLSAFLEACWLAEGWEVGDNGKTMAQNDGPVAEAMALAVYLFGQRPSFSSNGVYKGKENLNIHFSNAFVSGQWIEKKDLPSQQVWCPETELGSWTMRQGRTISLTGNSSSIGMDADIVLGLMQDEDMKVEEKMEVVMVKSRDSPGGKAVMDWAMDSMQFGERPQFLKKKGKVKAKAAKAEAKANSPFNRKNKGKAKAKKSKPKGKVVKGKSKAKAKPQKAKAA